MNDEIEIWKDVKGYEGLYKVSNKGRVYSFITNRYMIPQLSNNGYHYIDLTKDKCAIEIWLSIENEAFCYYFFK